MVRTLIFLFSLILLVQAQSRFEFLRQIYSENQDGQYNQVLLHFLADEILKTTDKFQQAELQWMQAQIQIQQQDTVTALVNFSKLVYLYPDSKFSTSALELLKSLKKKYMLPKFFYSDSVVIPKYLDVQETNFGFISDIYSIKSDCYSKPLIDHISSFLKEHPNSIYEDVLLLWQAQLFIRTDQPYFAESLFRLLIERYPQSSEYAQALLELARLNRNQLHDLRRSEQYYLELIGAFPEEEYGGTGQYELGILYADSLSDLEAAKIHLQLFQMNYADHPMFVKALKRLANLNEIQGNWAESCNYFQLFYEQAPQDSCAVTALTKIETIALDHLKDYKRAAAVMLIEARVLNDANKMYQAALIQLEQLKDPFQAKLILNRLIKEFPDSEIVPKAKQQLRKIE